MNIPPPDFKSADRIVNQLLSLPDYTSLNICISFLRMSLETMPPGESKDYLRNLIIKTMKDA